MNHLKYYLIAFAILKLNLNIFATSASTNYDSTAKVTRILNFDKKLSKASIVYICAGNYAYAYHSISTCPGLNNCKGEIRYTDEYSAVNVYRRRPCCRCWSNVGGNCNDDNPSYGSGGSGDGLALVAVVIVATSVIILSNDIYLYPTISFYDNKNNFYPAKQKKLISETGWIFGFRKTFKRSALEYGLSVLNYKEQYIGTQYAKTTYRVGKHLNFVHQLFYNKTPDKLKLYCGATFNHVFNYGFGGIVGAEIRLIDRLKFDVRYELTNQTNQIQAGLIVTFQKKYFWDK